MLMKIFFIFYWCIVLSNNNYEESLMFTRVLSVMTKLFFKISILLMCLGNPMISGIVDFANRVLKNIYVHKFVNCVYAKFKRNRVWSIAKKTSRSASLVSWTQESCTYVHWNLLCTTNIDQCNCYCIRKFYALNTNGMTY